MIKKHMIDILNKKMYDCFDMSFGGKIQSTFLFINGMPEKCFCQSCSQKLF